MKWKWKTFGTYAAGLVGLTCSLQVVQERFYFIVVLDGVSMEPTIHSGDMALGERRPKNVKHGDILMLKSPLQPEELIVKRLTGLPGDVKRSGFMFSEVPPGHMWLEGDNSSNSKDSRKFGSVPQGLIQGRLLYKIWPLKDARAL